MIEAIVEKVLKKTIEITAHEKSWQKFIDSVEVEPTMEMHQEDEIENWWKSFSEEVTDHEPEIDPHDHLTDTQIETLTEKYLKLGLSNDEIATKLEEYAQKAKACKEAEDRGLNNLSNQEKGNYGEMKADLDMLEKGYVRISKKSVTDLKQSIGQGIDGVYENPNSKPKYVILDAKYGTSQLQDTLDGKQLCDTWIDARLDNAVGKEKAGEIRNAMIEDNVGVGVARIDESGDVTYTPVDENGNETNKEVVDNG